MATDRDALLEQVSGRSPRSARLNDRERAARDGDGDGSSLATR